MQSDATFLGAFWALAFSPRRSPCSSVQPTFSRRFADPIYASRWAAGRDQPRQSNSCANSIQTLNNFQLGPDPAFSLLPLCFRAIYSLPSRTPFSSPSPTNAAPLPPERPHSLHQRRPPRLLRRRPQRHPPHHPPPRCRGAPRHRPRQRIRLGRTQCQLRGHRPRHGAMVRLPPSRRTPPLTLGRTDGMGWGPSRVRDVRPTPLLPPPLSPLPRTFSSTTRRSAT